MEQSELGLDFLLRETLELSEKLGLNNTSEDLSWFRSQFFQEKNYPTASGLIYKIENGLNTFCVRGFSTLNIRQEYIEMAQKESEKRLILKLDPLSNLDQIFFFQTKNFKLAEAIRLQVINRRFPHHEDSLCNLSDPGFSWWMNFKRSEKEERLEIFFRSYGVNRVDQFIQLGPLGDESLAGLRLNQTQVLLSNSFPISEFSCDDKSFIIASSKPDHSGFVSFKNIFEKGDNHTTLENFPDNEIGHSLYSYFQELATIRKFWIEVKQTFG